LRRQAIDALHVEFAIADRQGDRLDTFVMARFDTKARRRLARESNHRPAIFIGAASSFAFDEDLRARRGAAERNAALYQSALASESGARRRRRRRGRRSSWRGRLRDRRCFCRARRLRRRARNQD
jgi:hypothetical protein